jgi:predicted nuclease with TOPRIM domain
MGHNIGSTKTAYFRGNPDKLKHLYMKYVPFLSFADTEVRTIESAEYRELRDENTQMKSEMEAMKDKLSKVESFESHLSDLVAEHMDEFVHAKVKEMLKNVTEEDIQELT